MLGAKILLQENARHKFSNSKNFGLQQSKKSLETMFSSTIISLNCIKFKVIISFCTYKKVFPEIEWLSEKCRSVVPIMSEKSCSTDTRFGKAADFVGRFEKLTGNAVEKEHSLVADMSLIIPATEAALSGRQLQPLPV